jgi:hypothetical protein
MGTVKTVVFGSQVLQVQEYGILIYCPLANDMKQTKWGPNDAWVPGKFFCLFMSCFFYSTNFVTGFNSLTTTQLLTNAPTQMETTMTRKGKNNRRIPTRTTATAG